jgi:hypothetical protein
MQVTLTRMETMRHRTRKEPKERSRQDRVRYGAAMEAYRASRLHASACRNSVRFSTSAVRCGATSVRRRPTSTVRAPSSGSA